MTPASRRLVEPAAVVQRASFDSDDVIDVDTLFAAAGPFRNRAR